MVRIITETLRRQGAREFVFEKYNFVSKSTSNIISIVVGSFVNSCQQDLPSVESCKSDGQGWASNSQLVKKLSCC